MVEALDEDNEKCFKFQLENDQKINQVFKMQTEFARYKTFKPYEYHEEGSSSKIILKNG